MISGENPQGYKVVDVELKKDGKWYVGSGNNLRAKIIENIHSSPEGGHSGIVATAKRIQEYFYWSNSTTEFHEYLKACDTCQRCKAEHIASPGLLQPLPVPNEAWETISLDFIEGLPRLNGKEVILVVVDKLTKYAHFIALSHPYTSTTVAQIVLDSVVKLHGPPKAIISDRDAIFVSSFWKDLFTAMGAQIKLSMAYHPQTDG